MIGVVEKENLGNWQSTAWIYDAVSFIEGCYWWFRCYGCVVLGFDWATIRKCTTCPEHTWSDLATLVVLNNGCPNIYELVSTINGHKKMIVFAICVIYDWSKLCLPAIPIIRTYQPPDKCEIYCNLFQLFKMTMLPIPIDAAYFCNSSRSVD